MWRTSGQSPWQSCPASHLASGGDQLDTVLFLRRHRLAQAEEITTVRLHLPRRSRRRLPALANELSVVPWLKPRHQPLAAPWRASREGAA